jgi:hypothetical protein
MIKTERIQDEVAEAAAKAAWEIDRKSSGRSDFPLWEDLHTGVRHIQIERQRAALTAGLAAWPGAWHVDAADFEEKLILPLTQEKP